VESPAPPRAPRAPAARKLIATVVWPTCGSATIRPPATLSQQDRDEGAHLHHAVAACEFSRIEHLRQVGELHRAEQRGVQPHQEQVHASSTTASLPLKKPQAATAMIATLEVLHEADQASSCRTCR
jgi:hypothetical protein